MRKIIFVVLLLLIFFNMAFAQFRVGPLGGASVSRFVYEDEAFRNDYVTRFRPGYQIGLMLNYRVTKMYSLHTELSYLKKGIHVRYDGELSEVQNRASFSYLSAPALLRFSKHRFFGNQHVEMYVNIGPEVNYWLGGRGVLNTTESAAFVNEQELKYTVAFKENAGYGRYMVVDEPSRIQMAVAAGGGVIFDIGKDQSVSLDVRGSFGLGKSFHGKQEGGDYGLKLYSENLEGVHHTLSVNVAYILDFNLNSFLRKGRVARAF